MTLNQTNLVFTSQRGISSHKEVEPWRWYQRSNQANQIVVHIRGVPEIIIQIGRYYVQSLHTYRQVIKLSKEQH